PVEERRGVALAALAADADGTWLRAGESVGRVVAAGTGNGAVAGQDGVEEQPPAELRLGLGERVVLRDGALLVEAGRDEVERELGGQRVLGQLRRGFGARQREGSNKGKDKAVPAQAPHRGSSQTHSVNRHEEWMSSYRSYRGNARNSCGDP